MLVSKNNIGLLYSLNKQCKESKINLIVENSLNDLLFTLSHLKPKILFLDVSTMKGIDNTFIDFFNNQKNVSMPKVIVICSKDEYDNAKTKFSCEIITEENLTICKKIFNEDLIDYDEFEQKKSYTKSLKEKIEKFLFEAGISTKLMGYMFIKDCLELMLINNALIYSLDSKIYPMVACKYQTEKNNIERNIRNAIEKAYKIYGNTTFYSSIRLDENKNKLSNKQFFNLALLKLSEY